APGGQGYDSGISDYDPDKPSLWESPANKAKTVALWKRLAERYVDEPWVAGYDLLNEPNWDLPGGVALRALYEEITDSIRTVDDQHMIIIEGNWFANDFTGLTPPWDPNMVYSPHKYWSVNDQGSMQFAFDLRDNFNVPLYLGESGENSNVWFRDAIRLFEDNDMGWAWWPMKKIDAIAGPLSVEKTPEYQTLLDYWSGNGPVPTAAFAIDALMGITEGLKTENCRYQADVIDAMFRQVYSEETKPFKQLTIPGVIHAVDFDMGVVGSAYEDLEVANYQVTTGNFTSWNNGWSYRNDGVDIEVCQDNVNSNGFNVGWMESEDWMQYTVEVQEAGVYEIRIRAASGGSGGLLGFTIDGAELTEPVFLPPTGDWQNWQTTVAENVILDPEDQQLGLYVANAGYNLNSLEFVLTNTNPADLATEFVGAETVDEYTIQMNANKLLDGNLPAAPGDFEIFVDGTSVPIAGIQLNSDNNRILTFLLDYLLKSTDEIKISYTGTQIIANDGSALEVFTLEDVVNNLDFVHQIPGRIQAEAYTFQAGVELETTTDVGGGQNIAFLDPGDYLDYEINVNAAANYEIGYRTAAQYASGGAIELEFIDPQGNVFFIDNPGFASTGGWQIWQTTYRTVPLPAGRYVMRVTITESPFNLNWYDFDFTTNTQEQSLEGITTRVFPNPSSGDFQLAIKQAAPQAGQLEIVNAQGSLVQQRVLPAQQKLNEGISLADYPDGMYYLIIRWADGRSYAEKLVKSGW
ncbi:MAG: carbohydrate-binding protein, partial [Bacteroidota bacterium]